jgi:hypothetical protein
MKYYVAFVFETDEPLNSAGLRSCREEIEGDFDNVKILEFKQVK